MLRRNRQFKNKTRPSSQVIYFGEEKVFVYMKQLANSTKLYIILANSTKSCVIWCRIAWLGVRESPHYSEKEEFCREGGREVLRDGFCET